MTAPVLSVIIPTHNRCCLLQEMLMSLQRQTFPADQFEVVVVDDGSTDGTVEMVRKMNTTYSLRVLPQEQSGPSRARNSGARVASGKLLLFVDDDLLPKNQILSAHAQVLERDPGNVVLGRLLPWGSGPRGGWNRWEERVYEKHYEAVQDNRRPPSGRRLYSGNFSIWREQFLNAGGFDETLSRGEDVELGFRLERSGCHFHFSVDAAAFHRGYRTYESWCRSAYLYGRSDVQLAVQRGHRQVLDEIFGWYDRKPQVIRLVIKTALAGGKPVQQFLLQSFRLSSAIFDQLGFEEFSHYSYSAIFNLHYWQGVADELGGRSDFQRYAHAHSGHRAGVTSQGTKRCLLRKQKREADG